MRRVRHRLSRAALGAGIAAAASIAAAQQQDEKPAVERTVVDAPLAPAPGEIEGGDARLGLQPPDVTAPVDLGTDVRPNALVHVPVTEIYPGAVKPKIEIDVPDLDDEQRIWRGKQYYNRFNCIGCHAPHGAGGMGPSLSNTTFLYGQEPENIYLSILQGRPNGMPVWGAMLPDHIIWDLVAYVRRMARDGASWGRTVSLESFTTEQVPSGYVNTIDPWAHTQPFSFGQPPFQKVDTPTKQEPDDPAPRE
jgi:cytochrome c oxidase cbb3-type subunit III